MADFINTQIVSKSVAALGAALKSGEQSEGAVVDTVIAVSYMAMERLGRMMIAQDNQEGDKSADALAKMVKEVRKDSFDRVLKALIMSGRPVYRDSKEIHDRVVKIHNGKTPESRAARVEAVNAYMAECTAGVHKGKSFKQFAARDLVWTVASVKNFANKVIDHQLFALRDGKVDKDIINTDGTTYAKRLAQIEGEGQFKDWTDTFHDTYGKSFGAMQAAFKAPGGGRGDTNAFDAIKGALDKVKDLPTLERLLAEITARCEAERLNVEAQKRAGVDPNHDGVEIDDGEDATPEAHIVAPKGHGKPNGKTAH